MKSYFIIPWCHRRWKTGFFSRMKWSGAKTRVCETLRITRKVACDQIKALNAHPYRRKPPAWRKRNHHRNALSRMNHRTVVDRSERRTNLAPSRSPLILPPRTLVAIRRRWKPRGGSQHQTCQTWKKMPFGPAAVLPTLVGQADLRPSQTCWVCNGSSSFQIVPETIQKKEKKLEIELISKPE